MSSKFLLLNLQLLNRSLLNQALTHRSYGVPHNERLEFLGDSVLNCVIANLLYERFPEIPEGDLSRVRANLVNQQSLFELATALDLGQHVMLGQGELRSGGSKRPSILSDALEAVLGAVFLDAGFEVVSNVIVSMFQPVTSKLDPAAVAKDPKTRLQEFLQGRRMSLPSYTVVDASVGYRLPWAPNVRASVSVQNIFNNRHKEYVGAAELGRLVLARLDVEF